MRRLQCIELGYIKWEVDWEHCTSGCVGHFTVLQHRFLQHHKNGAKFIAKNVGRLQCIELGYIKWEVDWEHCTQACEGHFTVLQHPFLKHHRNA